MDILRAQVDTCNRLYWIMSGEILIVSNCRCCGTETQGKPDSENYFFRCKCGNEWIKEAENGVAS